MLLTAGVVDLFLHHLWLILFCGGVHTFLHGWSPQLVARSAPLPPAHEAPAHVAGVPTLVHGALACVDGVFACVHGALACTREISLHAVMGLLHMFMGLVQMLMGLFRCIYGI